MRRTFTLVATALAAFAVAACGGDDEEPASGEKTEAATQTETATQERTEAERTETEKAETGQENEKAPPGGAEHQRGEDQPGGAGDEDARVPAQLTGSGGRITPRTVRVPPYLAIRVELRSVDGKPYGLSFGGKPVRTGPQISSASIELDGLRPGQAITGRPVAGGTPVRIVANAEPGP